MELYGMPNPVMIFSRKAFNLISRAISYNHREEDYVTIYVTISYVQSQLFFSAASSTLPEKWKQEELLLQMTLRELETRYTILDQTIREVLRNSNTTARAAANFLSKPDATLETAYQAALELYGDLLKRSSDRRQEADNNLAMTKAIVRTLKARQQLFTDCFTQIRYLHPSSSNVVRELTFDNISSGLWRIIRLKSKISRRSCLL